jgi:hypothetical protein
MLEAIRILDGTRLSQITGWLCRCGVAWICPIKAKAPIKGLTTGVAFFFMLCLLAEQRFIHPLEDLRAAMR